MGGGGGVAVMSIWIKSPNSIAAFTTTGYLVRWEWGLPPVDIIPYSR